MQEKKHDHRSALDFARHAHRNQVDQSGRPYIEHIERVCAYVAALLDRLPPGTLTEAERDEILQAAALHDCAEDHEETGVTHADLEREGFAPGVRRRVLRLDKRNKVGTTYQSNIQAMAAEGDIGVIIVKIGDNSDNLDPARIVTLPPEKRSIADRYARSRETLMAAYEAFLQAAAPAPSPAP